MDNPLLDYLVIARYFAVMIGAGYLGREDDPIGSRRVPGPSSGPYCVDGGV